MDSLATRLTDYDQLKREHRETGDCAQNSIDTDKELREHRAGRNVTHDADVVGKAAQGVGQEAVLFDLGNFETRALVQVDQVFALEALITLVEVLAVAIQHPTREANQRVVIAGFAHHEHARLVENLRAVRDKGFVVTRVMQTALAHDGFETSGFHRQVFRVTCEQHRIGQRRASDGQHSVADVDADSPLARLENVRQEQSRSAAEVHHGTIASRHMGQDLRVPVVLEKPAELEGVAKLITRRELLVQLDLRLGVGGARIGALIVGFAQNRGRYGREKSTRRPLDLPQLWAKAPPRLAHPKTFRRFPRDPASENHLHPSGTLARLK